MAGSRRTVRGGGISITIDTRKVQGAIKRFPVEFAESARNAFRDGGIRWERQMKQRFVAYGSGSRTALQARTGNLRNTIRFRLNRGKGLRSLELRMIAGDNRSPQARAQEFGAVITPKRAGALTVPMPDALTASGAIRGQAVIRRDGRGFVTDLGPTFIYRPISGDRQGDAFIAVKKPGGGLTVLYVLKQTVTIPGPKTTGDLSRLGGIRTAQGVVSDHIIGELNEAALKLWRRG